MITIKIHDKMWFEKHCKVVYATECCIFIEPKYSSWEHIYTFSWSLTNKVMNSLTGQILKVELDDGDEDGDIADARYFIKGFWIPNWAIEWVKEEPDTDL